MIVKGRVLNGRSEAAPIGAQNGEKESRVKVE